ncbi:hypothetical protein Pmani_037507 [Petrolisthes manimaculis]|uniref:Uncharacterized protein n=1 Tax=Petrolisthes manimaculis TaxID=1843537 RepID=A0AAE1NI38_9EUCA|nr:hypothetical protein Pmani_037507 [Petrolisthes manimaculis]
MPTQASPEGCQDISAVQDVVSTPFQVNFAEVLDEVSSEDCTWEDGRTTYIEELEDDYAGLPITPDGQTDKEDPRAQINPNLDPEQRTALLELLQDRKLLPRETRYSTIEPGVPCLSLLMVDF